MKPANVFLTAQGVKLLDFGLARHTQAEAAFTAPALTMAGSVAGTLRCMAPEQATGDPVDERTDVFALGVMLFEKLTGHVPFNAETNVDWLKAVLNDDPEPLGRAELVALDPVVLRALQRRSADRYGSVIELAAALEAAVTRRWPSCNSGYLRRSPPRCRATRAGACCRTARRCASFDDVFTLQDETCRRILSALPRDANGV